MEHPHQGQVGPALWIQRWKKTMMVLRTPRAAEEGEHVNSPQASATKKGSQFESGLHGMEFDSMEKVREGFLGKEVL